MLRGQEISPGKVLSIELAPGPIGRSFDITLKSSKDRRKVPLVISFRGKAWSNCVVINEKANGKWNTELRYTKYEGDIDDLFAEAREDGQSIWINV